MKGKRIIINSDARWSLFYILGALKGDGHVPKSGAVNQSQFQLTTTSFPFAKSFERAMAPVGINYQRKHIYRGRDKPIWRVYAASVAFVKFSRQIVLDDWFKAYPSLFFAFLKGFYEAEGWLQTRVQRNSFGPYFYICISNADISLLRVLQETLVQNGYHPRLYLESSGSERVIEGRTVHFRKPTYRLALFRQAEVARLITELNPCIPSKRLPAQI